MLPAMARAFGTSGHFVPEGGQNEPFRSGPSICIVIMHGNMSTGSTQQRRRNANR